MMKNMMSTRYKGIVDLQISRRYLLTGTPLQNNLRELLSLLAFILPTIFGGKKSFHEVDGDECEAPEDTLGVTSEEAMDAAQKLFKLSIGTASSRGATSLSASRIDRAKRCMMPFLLRRSKDMVLKDLPQKISRVDFCTMPDCQQQIYKSVASRRTDLGSPISVAAPNLEGGGVDVIMSAAEKNKLFANLLMEMRKAANHPLLLRR